VFKVLIAEDDLIIADSIEDILVVHGYEVCGIARTVADAVELARDHQPDLAVFDLRLAGGDLGTDIAAQLRPFGKLGILYATGNISQVVLTDADGAACLSKPYRAADLLRSLEIVIETVTTGKASGPFPRGFQLLHPTNSAPHGVLV
jgi:CheY-like chemotaxis protein